MSNETFREFLKKDRIRRRVPSVPGIPGEVTDPDDPAGEVPPIAVDIWDDGPADPSSASVTERSSCVVEIRNRLGHSLTEPELYCCYGKCDDAIPMEVGTNTSARFAFKNSSRLLSGLFSYRMYDQVLLMVFSVYEDRNYFVVGITSSEVHAGIDSFMSLAMGSDEYDQQFGWAKDGKIEVQSGNILVKSSMTTDAKSLLQIEVSSALQ